MCQHVPTAEIPHVDLFLAPQRDFEDEARILRTWRLVKNPLELKVGESTGATPLQPHRGAYARLQGPVTPRTISGLVTPISSGEARIKEETRTGLTLDVCWSDGDSYRYMITADELQRLR